MHAGSNPVSGAGKICTGCKTFLPLADFAKRKSSKDGLQSKCKPCHRAVVNQHYADNKDYYKNKAVLRNSKIYQEHRIILIDYLRNHPCIDCGNSDVEVLQFDHRDQETKLGEVSKFLTYKTSKLLEEISKCDVRCANCHVKRSRIQLGWWTIESA